MPAKRSRPPHRSRHAARPNQRTWKRRREISIELNLLPVRNNASHINSAASSGHPDPENVTQGQLTESRIPAARSSLLSKIGLWLGVAVGLGALIVAIWYGFWNYLMQKWQAEKEFRDMCTSAFMTTNTMTAACDKALHKDPKLPPFTRRRPDLSALGIGGWDVKKESYASDLHMWGLQIHAPSLEGLLNWTIFGFPPGWTPENYWSDSESPIFQHAQDSIKSRQSYLWFVETVIASIVTFLATIIFTPLVVFSVLQVDAATSTYLRPDPGGAMLPWVATLLTLIWSGGFSLVLRKRAFVYHVGVAGVLHLVLALFTGNVNAFSFVMSLAAVVWVARKIQFRKVPRHIGGAAEFDRGFHRAMFSSKQKVF